MAGFKKINTIHKTILYIVYTHIHEVNKYKNMHGNDI